MAVADFQRNLSTHFDEFKRTLATDAGEWVVKGFIIGSGAIAPLEGSHALVQEANPPTGGLL